MGFEDGLVQWIITVISGESQTEICRQVLCDQPDMNIDSLFKRLDYNFNGYLCVADFLQFLEGKIETTSEEVGKIFAMWDQNLEGKISFEDFKYWILPTKNLKLKKLCLKRKEEDITYKTEYAFQKVLEKELQSQIEVEKTRLALVTTQGFSLMEAYKALDILLQGTITPEGVFRFLLSQGITVNTQEISGFFRRTDRSLKGNLSYSDFASSILPFSLTLPIEPTPPQKPKKEKLKLKKQKKALESRLSSLRKSLSIRNDFSLPDAYCFFTRKSKITEEVFEKGLHTLGVFPHSSDIYSIFRTYTRHESLNYTEFSHIFLHSNCGYSEHLLQKLPMCLNSQKNFSEETLALLSNFFTQLINYTRIVNEIYINS